MNESPETEWVYYVFAHGNEAHEAARMMRTDGCRVIESDGPVRWATYIPLDHPLLRPGQAYDLNRAAGAVDDPSVPGGKALPTRAAVLRVCESVERGAVIPLFDPFAKGGEGSVGGGLLAPRHDAYLLAVDGATPDGVAKLRGGVRVDYLPDHLTIEKGAITEAA